MKLIFKGWKREIMPHTHTVTPVQLSNGSYIHQTEGEPITWQGPFQAFGKVSELALSGSFLVEFSFQEQEIQNWLTEYVKAHPASALRLLAQAQAEAIIALGSSSALPDY